MNLLTKIVRFFVAPPAPYVNVVFSECYMHKEFYVDDGHRDYSLIFIEKWTVNLMGKVFDLTYKQFVESKTATLNGHEIPNELAALCFDAYFDPLNQDTQQKLIQALKDF